MSGWRVVIACCLFGGGFFFGFLAACHHVGEFSEEFLDVVAGLGRDLHVVESKLVDF